MKVSVVTVCFRAEATIAEAAASVLDQAAALEKSGHSLEYIIVDGASDDGTLDALSPYKTKIARLISEQDKGLYYAMNKGLAAATGELIAFLNADDRYADNRVLADVVSTFHKTSADGTNADGVYADLDMVDGETGQRTVRKWTSGPYRKGDFRKGWMAPHPTLVMRTKAMREAGGFNTALRSAADYEFMLRCIHFGERTLGYLPRTTVKMRAGGASNASLGNRLRANAEDAKAWRLNGARPPWHLRLSKPLRKLKQFFRN